MTMVEVDMVKNFISLSIPWPVVMINVKEVTQDGGGKKTMPLANAQQLEMIQKHTNIIGRPIKGSYKDQSGEDFVPAPRSRGLQRPDRRQDALALQGAITPEPAPDICAGSRR